MLTVTDWERKSPSWRAGVGTRGGSPVASAVPTDKVVSQAMVKGPEARIGEHITEALCMAPTLVQLRPWSLSWGPTRLLSLQHLSGWPCLPLEDLSDPEIEPMSLTSPALVGRFFSTSTTWEACPRQSSALILHCCPPLRAKAQTTKSRLLLATWPHVLQPPHTVLLALSGTPCSLLYAKFFMSNQGFEWGICEYVCPTDFLSCFSSRWLRSLLPRSIHAGPAQCLLHCRTQSISCWMYIKQAYNVCSHLSHWRNAKQWQMAVSKHYPLGDVRSFIHTIWVIQRPDAIHLHLHQSVHLRTSRFCSPGPMRAQKGLLKSLQQGPARSFALPYQEPFSKRKWV